MADVTLERRGVAAWVTFDRPEAHNAMTFAMYDRLVEHCETVDADDDIKVMVLRGAGGKAFVAGTDIRQFAEFKSAQDGLVYEARIDEVLDRLEAVQEADDRARGRLRDGLRPGASPPPATCA